LLTFSFWDGPNPFLFAHSLFFPRTTRLVKSPPAPCGTAHVRLDTSLPIIAMHLHSLRIGQGEVKGIPKHVAQASPFSEERAPTAPQPCLPGGPRSSPPHRSFLALEAQKGPHGAPGTGSEGVPQQGESHRRAKSFLSYISLPHIRLAIWVFFPASLLRLLNHFLALSLDSIRLSLLHKTIMFAIVCALVNTPAHWFSFGAQ